ncbi:MAG: GNAT family N-acetyltransferase [Neisseriaceae bacterium]
MNIRRLGAADAHQFKALRLEGLQRHPEAFGAAYAVEAAQPIEHTAEWLSQALVWGGFDAQNVLKGIMGLHQEQSPKRQHVSTIWGVYVAPDCRGTGMAQGLLQAVVTEARGVSCSIRLAVATDNEPAIRLYQQMGFTIWATERQALWVDGVFYDEYLMRLDVAEPEQPNEA